MNIWTWEGRPIRWEPYNDDHRIFIDDVPVGQIRAYPDGWRWTYQTEEGWEVTLRRALEAIKSCHSAALNRWADPA